MKNIPVLLVVLVMAVMSLACISSALQIPDATPPTAPETSPAVAASTAPAFVRHLYKVTADVLEIRSGAGEINLNIGYLHAGDIVTVYGTEKTTLEKCSEWADIDGNRWVCLDRLKRVN
jgi:hypothetical protein